MDTLRAILLGALQGATEFLPASSSGHLKLGQSLLGLEEPQLLFDIVLHVGTLLSVMLFYRRDVWSMLSGMLTGMRDGLKERSLHATLAPEGMRLAILIVLSTIPTGLIGVLLKDLIEPDHGPSPFTIHVICALLILNGFILITNLYFQRRDERLQESDAPPARRGTWTLWAISPLVALLLGVFQGLAVLPGISRSGTTITLALALKVERLHAARYSFLLSIPAILGALVLKLGDMERGIDAAQAAIFALGALVAGVVGYGCLLLLTRLLKDARFHHFAWYCWLIGILGLIYL